nr:hypothetical protein [Kofleriaceae bacterium]
MRFGGIAVAVAIAASASPAHAYEFWLRADEVGQAYQLRDYQLVGPDVYLGRRRSTTSLALRITDIGDLSLGRRVSHLPDHGLKISWLSYLRIDHDFGDYTSGNIRSGMTISSAIDAIPELTESEIDLQLMYGYLQLDGLIDDRLRVRLGRMLEDDGWGTGAVDGGEARYEVDNTPFAVTAFYGLRVRASSPLGVSAYELDGTSGAGCQEYVEGPTPGSGTWQLIDRNRATTNLSTSSDYAYCPQRDERQPTVGVTLATAHVGNLGAEIGYRRTWSDTVGLIGPVDRLDYPDLGLYPNDFGQAPATGVDEERLWARVHALWHPSDDAATSVAPYADARYSIEQAVLDRADAGVRITSGNQVLEPSIDYFFPTFDGDSIFNAFSIEPTTDARLTYQYAPTGSTRGLAELWLRRYTSVDDGGSQYAGGGEAGIEHALGGTWRGRVDLLADGGYGGRRAGGTVEVSWRWDRDLWLRGRAIVLDVREDDDAFHADRAVVTSSENVSTTWRVSDGVAIHGIVEADYDELYNFQTRVIGVLDLAFLPEP